MPVSILSLPAELIYWLYDVYSYPAPVTLAETCQDLRALRKSHRRSDDDVLDLLIERWPCYDAAGHGDCPGRLPRTGDDFFACG